MMGQHRYYVLAALMEDMFQYALDVEGVPITFNGLEVARSYLLMSKEHYPDIEAKLYELVEVVEEEKGTADGQ